MGLRKNKLPDQPDLNLPPIGAELPPLEFKGKRKRPKGKRRERDRDNKGRQYK